jgi:hypothetical protein
VKRPFERQNIRASARIGGGVKRYHTWPVHQMQTVADHSYHCIRIWCQIFGPPSPDVTVYFIWHDVGEMVTGDLPYPVKRDHPMLKEIADQIELQAVKDMRGTPVHLDDLDKLRTKVADLLEMHEFGIHELHLGNRYAEPIAADTMTNVLLLSKQLPQAEHRAVLKYLDAVPRE